MGLFVRKVKTASGATAVQIAQKQRGVRTILEHLGSGHDDTEVATLVAMVKDRIAEMQLAQGQQQLELPLVSGRPPQGAPVVAGTTSELLRDVLADA